MRLIVIGVEVEQVVGQYVNDRQLLTISHIKVRTKIVQ